MLTNRKNGVLYIGVTSNLPKRIEEHRGGFVDGFCKRYNLHRLVWFELHECISAAIEREKELKKWRRSWKVEMIERENPDWRDLAATLGW
nr:GIY-YIG nuclease family protein [Wenzhouxiangella sp. XN79A]